MMNRTRRFFRRFRRGDEGHATIEFAIMVPILLMIMLSSIELGMMTLRYAFLERALDVVVRDIRLSTGVAFDHATLRNDICEEAGMIPDCNNNLLLEMVILDPRAWTGLPNPTKCTNRAEEVQPVTTFASGDANQLMFLRACAKVEPLFPTTGLGAQFDVDAAGDYRLIASTAFVQEPR